MERKTFELGGIVRNLPDNLVKDGTMQELINLRMKDGALRPVGLKASSAFTPVDVRFIHSISSTVKVYIGGSDPHMLGYWVEVSGVIGAEVITSIDRTADMTFGVLKNVLVVSEHQNEVFSYMIFDEGTNTYNVIRDRFFPQDMPQMTIQRVAVPADDVSGDTFDVTYDSALDDALSSQYVKMQREKANDGYLSGKVLVRFAWELFDGSLVKHTIPDLIPTSEITTAYAADGTLFDGDGGWKITTSFSAQKLQFQIACTALWLSAFQTTYKNLIRSLRVYVSMPKSPEIEYIEAEIIAKDSKYKPASTAFNRTERRYDTAEIKNYVPDPANENWYLLKEFKLSDLAAATWTDLTTNDEEDSVQDLGIREQLTVDNFTHHTIFGKRMFAYNERLFIADIRNELYRNFPLEGLLSRWSVETGVTYNVAIEYEITVPGNKTIKVLSAWESLNWYSDIDTSAISFSIARHYDGSGMIGTLSYWGYPDARATKARVLVRIGDYTRILHTQELTSHPLQNFSIAKGLELTGVFLSLDIYEPSLTPSAYTYYDTNRVQASELNNPLYFPAINSYRLGLGTVLGLSSNAIALSTGQFGQYPVFAFCTDGIWTMSIGNGEVLINNITTLSREVCNNPDSITPIDGGVAFTSGKGLNIISGNQVIEISEIAEGKHTGPISSLDSYLSWLNTAYITPSGLGDPSCQVPLNTFLTGAIIGHDYIEKELIVSNSSYTYSWVYNLKYKSWHKIHESFNRFVYDFPSCYGLKASGHIYNINSETLEGTEGLACVMLKTRPIKLGGVDLFKKIHRLLIGGDMENVPGMSSLSIAIFATTDFNNWFLLDNSRTVTQTDRMLLGRSKYSLRWAVLCFAGFVGEDSYFNYASFDTEDRYGNKLR